MTSEVRRDDPQDRSVTTLSCLVVVTAVTVPGSVLIPCCASEGVGCWFEPSSGCPVAAGWPAGLTPLRLL